MIYERITLQMSHCIKEETMDRYMDIKKIKNEILRIFQEFSDPENGDSNAYDDIEKVKDAFAEKLGEEIINKIAALKFNYEIIENIHEHDELHNELYGGQQRWRLSFIHE